MDKSIDIVKNNVNDIEKNQKFSTYVQSMVIYFLAFTALLGVMYIIYAGVIILTAGGDENKVKKSKTHIFYVMIGFIVIFLAYSIIKWTIRLLNFSYLPDNTFIERSYAYTDNDANTFDEYKKQVELLKSELDRDRQLTGKLSSQNLDKLRSLVSASMDTFPDNTNYISNMDIAKDLLIKCDVVMKSPDSDQKITEFAMALRSYLTSIRIPRISASFTASPSSGNAPLTTTLRVNEVDDPSGVEIRKSNFVWSTKLSDGTRKIIGVGPSINATFKEQKDYKVYLDIVSGSRNKKNKIDVLPFSGELKINVLRTIGNIYLYFNGVNVSDLDRLKITPTIGKAGIVIDATTSQPAAGSSFTKTQWDFGNGNSASYDLGPKMERQIYAREGTYNISLNLRTNEGNTVAKSLSLEVKDPVASISANKTDGFVNEEFKFGVSTAFQTAVLNYEWQIAEIGSSGPPLYTSNKPNISFNFKKVGKYSVRLKSFTPAGKEDSDTVVITIDSRDPIAALVTTQKSPQTPNIFRLDASTSFDQDTNDTAGLNFTWMIDGKTVELENPESNGKVGNHSFNTLGEHKIMLTVTNKAGKAASVTNKISVTSLLNVRMQVDKRVAKIGAPVTFLADSKESILYEWDFGDGEQLTTQEQRQTHVYKKSGFFTVFLKVNSKDMMETNTISKKIYIGDGADPSAFFTIKKGDEELIPTPGVCSGKEAFIVDRASPTNFSAVESLNVDGTNNGLKYSWSYVGKASTQRDLSYKFDELGCFPIALTVKSQKNGRMSSVRSYVKVENLLPTLSGLKIEPVDEKADPVIVKVTALNPKDADGSITSYLWYYYSDSDVEQKQDYRITKLPTTTFVIPRVNGRYYFVVTAEDTNGAKVTTANLTDQNSLQLITDNINTPIIKLSVDRTSINVGEEINFSASVTDITGVDISGKVEYKWDFDGDGFYDKTTNSPKISYKYPAAGSENMKLKVTYKGISNTKYQQVLVKNTLKPNLEYYAIGSKIVLFNTSQGTYTKSSWNLGDGVSSENLDSFAYDFSDGKFPSVVNLKISDGSTTKSTDVKVKKDAVNLSRIEKSESNLVLFSYPLEEDGTIHLKSQNDKLFLYLGSSKGTPSNYCIDNDTSVDSDFNGTADDDCDNKGSESYTTGSPYVVKGFDKTAPSANMKLSILKGESTIESKDLKIVFDFVKTQEPKTYDNNEISAKDKEKIEQLKDLIKKSPEKERLQMMKFISLLQENWFDEREKTRAIVDFESYVNALSISQDMKDKFYTILESFLSDQGQAKDEVTLAAKVLTSLIPKTNKNYAKIKENVDLILSHPTNTKENKELGLYILNAIKDDDSIPNKDKLLIKSQLQVIIYGSQKDIPENEVTPADGSSGSALLSFVIGFVKVLLWVFGAIVGLFLILFVYFKISNKNENLSFQDFIIELFVRNGRPSEPKQPKPTPPPQVKPEPPKQSDAPSKPEPSGSQSASTSNTPSVSDQGKAAGSVSAPVSGPESFSTQPIDAGNALPDWLKGSSISTPVAPASQPQVETPVAPPKGDDSGLPDWLKGSSVSTPAAPTPQPQGETPVAPSKGDDSGLPDWLKGMNQSELEKEVEEELSSDSKMPKESPGRDPNDGQDEDLPDWLRKMDDQHPQAPDPIENTDVRSETGSFDQADDSELPAAAHYEDDRSDANLPDWLKDDGTEEDPYPEEDEEEPDDLSDDDSQGAGFQGEDAGYVGEEDEYEEDSEFRPGEVTEAVEYEDEDEPEAIAEEQGEVEPSDSDQEQEEEVSDDAGGWLDSFYDQEPESVAPQQKAEVPQVTDVKQNTQPEDVSRNEDGGLFGKDFLSDADTSLADQQAAASQHPKNDGDADQQQKGNKSPQDQKSTPKASLKPKAPDASIPNPMDDLPDWLK